ncbi:hypothetical protein JXO52_15085 [bacterium]|nr:hypothetical protein [bacterium]
MKLEKIKELLQAEELTSGIDLNLEIASARASDLMSDVLSSSHAGDLLLTGLVNAQAVRTANVVDMKVIIFVRDKAPAADTIQLAEQWNIHLLATKKSMLEACGLLWAALY